MLTKLIKSLTEINTLIARIDYALIELDHKLEQELILHPESVNYNIDPNSHIPDRHIVCEYPIIHVCLCPFKTTIKYEDIFKAIKTNNYETTHIIEIVVELINKQIYSL